MIDGYETFFDAVYYGDAESGKAIRVGIEGNSYWIPNFAIHDASEIQKDSKVKRGAIHIRTDIAEDKDIGGGGKSTSGGTGVGIPLKRHRLPPEPDLMPQKRLEAIARRWDASSAHESGWVARDEFVNMRNGSTVALFEGPFSERDAEFAAHAPDDINDLLNEVVLLREWVKTAIKTRQRRKRPKK